MTSRRVIHASALGNVVLFLVVGFLAAERRGGAKADMTVPSASVKSPTALAGTFQWSQLESTNFPSYVANLRGVGCPEQTLRDIIAAEVQALHSPVQQAILEIENSTGRRLVAEREKLIRDQGWLVDHFLGVDRTSESSPGRSDGTLDSTEVDVGRSSAVNPAASPGRVVTGLRGAGVAQSGRASSGPLADQASASAVLGSVSAAGGSLDQSDDPAGQPDSRWRQARSQADQHLRVMFGDEAFLRFERERHLSAIRSQSAP